MRAGHKLGLWMALGAVGLACESYPEVTRDPAGGGEGGGSSLGGSPSGGTGGTIIIEGGAPATGGSAGSSSVCGNGELEPGELCEDGNTLADDGCSADCAEQDPDYVCLTPGDLCEKVVVCGSGALEGDEDCDDGNTVDGDGCAADCSAVEAGWLCPRPDRPCVALPECGNGVLERGETCDDSNAVSSDGCTGAELATADPCQLESGYFCAAPGDACAEIVCGDGQRAPSEACDDGDTAAGDGCSADCAVEDGFRCTGEGTPCAAICGDGLLLGDEDCDDANLTSGDGCNAACRLEPRSVCPDEGAACVPTECGNNATEPGEGCDDANAVAGDGCSPTCQLEPTVTVGPDPVVNVFCGDGLLTGAEACDDGNTTAGDGCSVACAVETGFTCESIVERPESVSFRVTYRDLRQRSEVGGHPHMRVSGQTPPSNGNDRGIPGEICDTSNTASCGRLDVGGKPALDPTATEANIQTLHPTLYAYPEAFTLWYRGTNPAPALEGYNGAIELQEFSEATDYLTLTQQGGATSDVYSFGSSSFFPLNGRGFGDTPGRSDNFHFTTELRYFFQYQGGETLTFRGDDDVFVYVNGRLAVDIGGIHAAEWGRVVLGDDGEPSGGDCTVSTTDDTEPPDCTLTAAELTDPTDSRFGLTRGGVYEIVLFHAERQPTASNFYLTLTGFLAPRSFCTPVCGDGQVVGWEVCDDGTAGNTGEYGQCDATCTGRTYCGDALRQGPTDTPAGPEACDNGFNGDLYSFDASSCAEGCVLPPYCGDGQVEPAFELCDAGPDNSDTAYDGCTTSCEWGPYCGESQLDEPDELCDAGADNTLYSSDGTGCGPDCAPPPFCGDGIRNGPEHCDAGTELNTGEYGGCNADCTRAPYCGDRQIDTANGEACDDGTVGSLTCTPACLLREEVR